MPSILLEYKHAPVHERQHETSDRDVLWQGHCPNAALDGVAGPAVVNYAVSPLALLLASAVALHGCVLPCQRRWRESEKRLFA